MHRPQKRAVKLWLPTDADKEDIRCIFCLFMSHNVFFAFTRYRWSRCCTICEAFGWSRVTSEHEIDGAVPNDDQGPEPEDDLDQLFAQYEQQAEADKRKLAAANTKERSPSQKSMKELRECGLSQPLGQDTRFPSTNPFHCPAHRNRTPSTSC